METDSGAPKVETTDPAVEETPAPAMPVEATLASSHEVTTKHRYCQVYYEVILSFTGQGGGETA